MAAFNFTIYLSKLFHINEVDISLKIMSSKPFGLSNVDRRIKFLFGNDYGIEIFNNNGAEIIINLPIDYM